MRHTQEKSPAQPLLILVIDDDANARTILRDILEQGGYRVETATTFAAALAWGRWAETFAAIIEHKLPDGAADQLLPRLKQLSPHTVFVVVTTCKDVAGAVTCMLRGSDNYIAWPKRPYATRLGMHTQNRSL